MTARAFKGHGAGELSYDLIAIGSGQAGRAAAIQAAKLGKRVAVVERQTVLGGACTHTVPSKTLRAAIMELTTTSLRGYGRAEHLRSEVAFDDLSWRARQVIEHEQDAVEDELRRNRVDVLTGTASFIDAHTLRIESSERIACASAARFVIAVGTKPVRPSDVAFDDEIVLDSDGILLMRTLPAVLTVVGATGIGFEYASMLAAVGTRVTLVDRCRTPLGFVDDEIVDALCYHLGGRGVVFRLGDEVEGVERVAHGALIYLRGGDRIASETLLYAAGRHGATADLNLSAAGVEPQDCGRIAVGPDFRTEQSHIFAAGDVIGSSRPAVPSKEQGRMAALCAFNEPLGALRAPVPQAIYTIPEISFVGPHERNLIESGVPHARGVARYRDLTRGEMAGDRSGLVKLLAHHETHQLLGVHAFGTSATELIHLGQLAMAAGLTVDYLAEAAFNFPTYAESYNVAALDALDRLAEMGKPRGRKGAGAQVAATGDDPGDTADASRSQRS